MRVLVIEDEENVAEALERGLAADGWSVAVERDGGAGLERAVTNEFDVIVLDILLPTLNGYRVCQQLRHSGVETPILMLTAKDGDYDEAEGLDLGADDYMRKPFSFVVLRSRLRALTRRARSGNAAMLSVGDLELDLRRRRCLCRGETIHLTPRELDLLEVLARNAPWIVSKETLLDEVWGESGAGNHNLAEVYVGYLRRKLDRPFGTERIQTVRNQGYRLVPVPADTPDVR